jgi:beta,beta-carotene 9',10'-dioxygenase
MATVERKQDMRSLLPSNLAGTRRGAFLSMEEEVRIDRLPARGSLPSWLNGTLIRVTPALMEIAGKTTRHWFDGLAMLNAFAINGGHVSYASRFLQSESYREAREGRVSYLGIANDPCRALFRRVTALFEPTFNDNCNVNIVRLGQRHLAMTELPLPVEFDPETLDTLGLLKWQDRLRGQLFSAHPHYDHRRDEMISYLAHVGVRNSYRIYSVAGRDSARKLIATLPTSEIGYIHSFGLTERYVVLAEFPLLLNPKKMLIGRYRPLAHHLQWRPERGTRFFVVDRADGGLRGTYEADGFFAFHHVNAFERTDELVVDLIVNEDGPSWIRAFELERLRGDASFGDWSPRLHRFRLPLNGGAVSSERLAEPRMDLPRINYRQRNTHEYRYIYATSFRSQASDWFDQLVKIDVRDGHTERWSEEGCYPGEPVFTAQPGTRSEDQGAVLSVVFDSRTSSSYLVVLDARTFEELGRAEVPHHIPFGFHGNYFPTAPEAATGLG